MAKLITSGWLSTVASLSGWCCRMYCLAQSLHHPAGSKECTSVSLWLCSCFQLVELITNSQCYTGFHRTQFQPIPWRAGRSRRLPKQVVNPRIHLGCFITAHCSLGSYGLLLKLLLFLISNLFLKQTRAFSPLLCFSSHLVFFCLLAYPKIRAVSVSSLKNFHMRIQRDISVILSSLI